MTNWMTSVAKTRLQLDKEKKYKGMFDCLRKVSAEEGPKALYKGLTPFVTHLTLKYALRFGLFEKIRVLLNGGKTSASSNAQNFFAGEFSFLSEGQPQMH